MTLTDLITIRISSEEHLLYEAEAAYRKQSLSSYLRERLKKSETSSHELQKIHDLLKNLTASSFSHDQGILLEILLLLRYLSSPKKILLVHRELNRLNIPVWQGDSFSKE